MNGSTVGQPGKIALRRSMRRRLRSFTPEQCLAAGRPLAMALDEMGEFAGSACVCVYLSMAGEVATSPAIELCRRRGKRVVAPAWNEAAAAYRLAELASLTRVRRGPLGVPEPEDAAWVPPRQVDFVLVPGLAFDLLGGRLGRGGGHFDRLLAVLPEHCLRVGVAFEAQLVVAVPMLEHDVKMHFLLTEKQTRDCRDNKPVVALEKK